jgi:mono/diheme cytochrome c family protein
MSYQLKVFLILVSVIGAFALACSRNAESVTYNSTGVIKSIDVPAREVTIDHEDIPGFMSAMEMSFSYSDPAIEKMIAVGDTVDFTLVRTDAGIILLRAAKIDGPAASVNGADIFAAHCAECHGEKGEGTKKGIPLISGHAVGHPRAELIEQVNNGDQDKMPAFRSKLTAREIEDVVDHVRTVIQADRSPDAMQEHKH